MFVFKLATGWRRAAGFSFTSEIKILPKCTLPLTGVGVISQIITDLCVLDITRSGLNLVELAPGVTKEEVIAKTGAPVDTSGF